MLNSLLNALFGCTHDRTTFPLTPGRKPAGNGAHRHGMYVVCLDCGQEFRYNWAEMRVASRSWHGHTPRPLNLTRRSTIRAVLL